MVRQKCSGIRRSYLAWVLFLVVATFALLAFKSSKYWVFYSADKGGKNE
ncbi:hypothetical protein WP4W18E05_19690 [Klebsiella sp. WP4-W18-ESBL-05]|nr:hypothetical protein WP4W18E05_19690 [Klebsiella sp. WP4-W18-ESBL-05]